MSNLSYSVAQDFIAAGKLKNYLVPLQQRKNKCLPFYLTLIRCIYYVYKFVLSSKAAADGDRDNTTNEEEW